MELNKIIDKIEKKYPLWLKEEWDNVGLAVGDTSSDVNRVMITLDVTEKVIEKAVEKQCGLIISHHPLIFKGVGNVTNKTLTGKKIIKLIKNDIALYTAHTNADSAAEGLNAFVLKKLGVEKSTIADVKYYDTVKFSIYVPESSFEILREKLVKINKFTYNNYSGVTYSSSAQESFIPLKGALPSFGETDKTEYSSVKRIDIIVYRNQIKEIINEIKKTHPYEEPAYEITEIDKRFPAGGIGRVFELSAKTDVEEYLEYIKNIFKLERIKSVYEQGQKIRKVGLINGSGMSFFKRMKELGVDMLLTADIKYHEALEAREYGIALADIGHFESEYFFGEMIKEELDKMEIESIIFNNGPVFNLF